MPPAFSERAAGLVPGARVTSVEPSSRGWQIDLEASSGALVRLEVTVNGRIVEGEGREGPFDYAVTPPGLISLSRALETVDDSSRVETWSLSRMDARMVWSLGLASETLEVDAATGESRN
ncbi:MAG: hypothetical protein AAFZ18_09505 [Myxococcota bacterium]